MRSCRAGRLVAVLLLLPLWPALALAQPPKAGVVTTLQGQATVARAALPQPIPIKFKDDVFRQDRIDTREDSVVRVLLGGKALVTIRELSTFTVTEEPGRAVVDLKTGKIALAVAERLLRPGETVEVRTPHAIAAVRGSFSVFHVTNVTNIWHLQGKPLELFTPARAPLPSVDPGQKLSASLVGIGPKESIPPGEAKDVAKTGEAPKPKEQSDKPAGGESIGKAKMDEATKLAEVLAPAEVARPGADTTVTATPTTTLDTSTSDIGVQQKSATEKAAEAAPPDVPDVLVSNTTRTLAASDTLKTFTGTVNRKGSSPVVQISSSTVSGSNHLILFDGQLSPVNVTLAGPLLEIASTVTTNSDVIEGTGTGSFTSTTSLPVIKLTSASLTAGGGAEQDACFVFIEGAGNTITLNGIGIKADSSSLTLTGQLLEVTDGAKVISNSTEPFASITGGSHSIGTGSGQSVFELRGRSTQTTTETVTFSGTSIPSSTLTLGTDVPVDTKGEGLVASGATITTQKGAIIDTALVDASAPLMVLKASSTFNSDLDGLDLFQKAKVTGVGPLLVLDASTMNVTTGAAFFVRGGSLLNVTGDLISLKNAATLNVGTATTSGTILKVSGGSVAKISGALLAFTGTGNTVNIKNTFCSPSCTVIGGLNVFLTNSATSANVSITSPIKNLTGNTITLTSSTTTAHIVVDGSTSKVAIAGN